MNSVPVLYRMLEEKMRRIKIQSSADDMSVQVLCRRKGDVINGGLSLTS
jgi:hypothetical protein